MKIIIERRDSYTETQVHVCCSTQADPETEALIQKIQEAGICLNGTKNNHTHKLRLNDIFYIECVDDKTFLYTSHDSYESSQRIYQLEEQLTGTSFVRISKSVLLNIEQLDSVKPLLNARIEAHLRNGEKLLINRHYVTAFREKFGV